MRSALVWLAIAWSAALPAQEPVKYKVTVVALSDDPQLRREFEDGLVAKGLEHEYDAVPSYPMLPDIGGADRRRFNDALAANGIKAVLMLRPAAIGEGSSIESVRDEVSPELFTNMRTFARQVSPTGGDDLLVVVHMAVYLLGSGAPELISSGAVWLSEPVESQAEGIARLQDLVLANVDAVRPAIRRHLGLPPL